LADRGFDRRHDVTAIAPTPDDRPRIDGYRVDERKDHPAGDIDVVDRGEDWDALADQVVSLVAGAHRGYVRRCRNSLGEVEELVDEASDLRDSLRRAARRLGRARK
jgi:hypothetical protein